MGKQDTERNQLLTEFNQLTEKPLIFLSLVWIVLIILELTVGISTALQVVSYIIWAIFIVDFIVEYLLAPNKVNYVKNNLLTVVSLIVPAVRVFRLFRGLRLLRAARAVRSASLVRIVAAVNRGIRTIQEGIGARGIGYVIVLTIIIIFIGAAGILFFEQSQGLQPNGGINNYGDALWWTAMIITTMGSDYWPVTVEGRILTFLLSVYAFAIFGYITASIASYFVGKDMLKK